MESFNDVETFHEVLRSSRRILALCGAGLSVKSGLPTFRGTEGYWRNYETTQLSTMRAFSLDAGIVWLFHNYRRHLALKAQPNAGHKALAALARTNSDFLCLTQNVDNLSQRADHPPEQLQALHGSLFDIKCAKEGCDWFQKGNFDDPFCPALAPASEDVEPMLLLNPYHRIDRITEDEIPKCPQCNSDLQRPGIVWYGENLDGDMLASIDNWILQAKLDLMLVIGTSAQVFPAAGYIHKAKKQGARICTINLDAENPEETYNLRTGDFAFGGDAAEILPMLLWPVIGKMNANGEFQKE